MLNKLEATPMPLTKTTIFLVFTPPKYNYNNIMRYMSNKVNLPLYSPDAVSISSISMSSIQQAITQHNGCVMLLELTSEDRSNIREFYDALSDHHVVTIFLKIGVHVRDIFIYLYY
jgi:uncharacterized SAM-dependent methyltransferase